MKNGDRGKKSSKKASKTLASSQGLIYFYITESALLKAFRRVLLHFPSGKWEVPRVRILQLAVDGCIITLYSSTSEGG